VPDAKDDKRKTEDDVGSATPGASPYSSGGGGVRLEHRVGVVWLVRLLNQTSASSLGELPPVSVAFQQSGSTAVDDLVITAAGADGRHVRLDVAVRRSPRFVRSHAETAALVEALVRADLDAEGAGDAAVERRLAIAVRSPNASAREVAELASVARSHGAKDTFFALIRSPGKFATAPRLEHLLDLVRLAVDALGLGDEDVAEQRTWSLLRRLWVMQLKLEAPEEEEWTSLIDALRPVVPGGSHAAAVALRGRMDELAGEFAKTAAVIDPLELRRHLYGYVSDVGRVRPAGWSRLLELDEQARASISRSLAGARTAPLELARQPARDALRNALAADTHVLVTGGSGVGKSALVMDAIEPERLEAETQAVAVNLRQLPATRLELTSALGSSPAELWRELDAPRRILVIDAAEACSEGRLDAFSSLVESATRAGLQVVVVAAEEGTAGPSEVLRASGRRWLKHVVEGLDDDDLAAVEAHIPTLQPLLKDPRSRELLRRPIVVDLLSRVGDPGLPLSESQALEAVWTHLVTGGPELAAGQGAARESAMLRLARHELVGGDVDDLLERLDSAAIDGLRLSGLLGLGGVQPWERVPVFRHELLRTYALARFLVRNQDPVSELAGADAPRWALPAARLACQILLEAATGSATERLEQLEEGFASLTEIGGVRWSDVPTEALLLTAHVGLLLDVAWPRLLENDGRGLARLLRVLTGRHADPFLDVRVAEPVVRLLAERPGPQNTREAADDAVSEWLRAHVVRGTPAGHPVRLIVRDHILQTSAELERQLDEREALRAADAGRRSSDDSAELETDSVAALLGGSRRRRRRTGRRPYEWIDDAAVEQLALLGEDIGAVGEAVLRRIAEDDPSMLDHAVEPILAGHSIASYKPGLLTDLAAAYYIEDFEEDRSWSYAPFDDGIRRHRPASPGTPLASCWQGPFIALFRNDFLGGVAFLNRMLNHAAWCRIRTLQDLNNGYMPADEEADSPMSTTLTITGERRHYLGDQHVWLWYRGTGVGPYPCMSALQALEFVVEEVIGHGVPMSRVSEILLEDAHSLAMPGLVLAILVRHLEAAGELVDPFLAEPAVWELEFSRTVSEHTGLAARQPELARPERRQWSLREVAMAMALGADEERAKQLQEIGRDLEANEEAQSGSDETERLVTVRGWASALDRGSYEIKREDDHLVVSARPPQDVADVLQARGVELERVNAAYGLLARHANTRRLGGPAPALSPADLAQDVSCARDLLEDPPEMAGTALDAIAAVASSVLELHFTGRVGSSDEDLTWASDLLLRTARALRRSGEDDESLFLQGADRSAARALPLLALPAAQAIRAALHEASGPPDDDVLLDGLKAIALNGPAETRLQLAQALDALWIEPCAPEADGRACHHATASDVLNTMLTWIPLGRWDEHGRRAPVALDPLAAATLDSLKADQLNVAQVTAPIRAAGAAAAVEMCRTAEARAALRSLLDAHQRGMLAFEHGYHHSDSDALVAARAALSQAGRDDDAVLDYVRRYSGEGRLLAEALRAVAAAAQERAAFAAHARRLWPVIMDVVLDAADDGAVFRQRTWGDYAHAALIPNRTSEVGYLTRETDGTVHPWRDLLSWKAQVDRWLVTVRPGMQSIDQLVIAVSELDVPDQLSYGLRWIERAVSVHGDRCPLTYTLPEWLGDRRTDLGTEEHIRLWQKIVDVLVVSGDRRVAGLAD
jgi:hypothetical protein